MVPLDKSFVAILISFLDRADHAGDVLNDYLEEQGQSRLVPVDADSISKLAQIENRLALILNVLLPTKFSSSIACEFSRHAVKSSSLTGKVVRNANKFYAALTKLDANEEATFEDQKKLMTAANKFLSESWSSDG